MNFKQKTALCKSLFLLCGILAYQNTAFADNFPELRTYTPDTIAGYTTVVKTETPFENQEILFKIIKPDKTELVISTLSKNGEATIDLYDYHTKQAGSYFSCAKYVHQEEFGPCTNFHVYADEVSTYKSYIEVNKKTAAANNFDTIEMTVNLRDKYGNPISNHQINIVPSRPEDKVGRISSTDFTDQYGQVRYRVASAKEGIGVFSFFDITNSMSLEQRVNIIFFRQSNFEKEIGGNTDIFLSQVNAQSNPGQVAYFKIEDMPETVKPNQSITFKIIAYDTNSNIATNYTGTIRFSSSDNNATLPSDYDFKGEDLGGHTFSLGLTFITTGTQTLTVTDISNPDVKGEIQVEVNNQSQNNNPNNTNDGIKLVEPSSGTYQATILTVSGQTLANSAIALYIDDIQQKSLSSDNTGNFLFETPPLSIGDHILYIATTDKNGNILDVSEARNIKIDTDPPRIDSLELSPSGKVLPGETIQATLYSEQGLTQAGLILESKIIELIPSLEIAGTYTGIFQAPQKEGSYDIDLILVDKLGNEASYSKQKTLQVSNLVSSTGFIPEIGSGENSPGKVENVEAVANNNRVTLYWDTPDDNTYITHYRVYFGTNSNSLDQFANTFTNDNTWYVPDLTNGVVYYFALTAFDSDGNESISQSAITSSTPRNSQSSQNQADSGENDPPSNGQNQPSNSSENPTGTSLENPKPAESPKTGPETLIILFLTLIFTNIYFIVRLKPSATLEKTDSNNLNEIPTHGYKFRFINIRK